MTHVTPLDDERRLVDAARAGDRRAIERLLRSHQAQLHAVCRRITGNDVDALGPDPLAWSPLRGGGNFHYAPRFGRVVEIVARLEQLHR